MVISYAELIFFTFEFLKVLFLFYGWHMIKSFDHYLDQTLLNLISTEALSKQARSSFVARKTYHPNEHRIMDEFFFSQSITDLTTFEWN